MASSGTYNFTVTRDDIIRMAMLSIGQLDEIEPPTAQETTDMTKFLNMLVKQWQGKADFAPGLKTFTRRHGHLFLSNTTGQYTLGPAGIGWTLNYVQSNVSANVPSGSMAVPLTSSSGILSGDKFGAQTSTGNLYWGTVGSVVGNTVNLTAPLPSGVSFISGSTVFDYATTATQPIVIEDVFLRDINNSDTPLKILTVQEYDFNPSKTNPQFISDPTSVYYEFQLTNSYLFTDCAAANDTSKHICITYLEAIQDITNPADTTVYPQEWFLALVWGLAKQSAPMFHATWTPVMQENYREALAIAQRKEPERSVMYFSAGEDL